MHSTRFGLPVVLTEHARLRMAERSMDAALVLEIIDTGIFKDAGKGHCWLYKHFDDRADNLLCVAAVIENALVVKTIMHHWEPLP
ncbi:DUF4258 domain-containing protein [Polaromonas naphthalenivorans]|uniref:DUF4258 domain-containing protein n=1 Tax=Polaromonas naphthalenivorans (strain CJ2) TaxID=365044 RepID=A1VLY7_POLNA|nr:DUF4258 domain-containing protein [Polaromonas naphthalenivorans]ABM36665.1 conserved hypothetical protein [Polaromonas naphthalenivorans CJ2]